MRHEVEDGSGRRILLGPPDYTAEIVLDGIPPGFEGTATMQAGEASIQRVPFTLGPLVGEAILSGSPYMEWFDGNHKVTMSVTLILPGATLADVLRMAGARIEGPKSRAAREAYEESLREGR